MKISRDSLILWFGFFGSILGYLATGDTPPTQWSYHEWIQAGIAVIGITVAWLRTSPLANSNTPIRDTTTAFGVFNVYDKPTGGQK